MSVTIYEIAEKADVSSSTVSRALRDDAKEVRPGSTARAADIRRIASELGYRPNVRARGFSQRRTFGIGMLYTDYAWIFEGMNTQVVSSLVRTLQQSGYHLVFAPIDDSGSWEDIVLGGQIDGCVVFQKLPDHVDDALRDRQLPIVLLGDDSDPEVSRVVVDDFAGAYAATKHLIGLGHKRIGYYVHDLIKPHCSIDERLRGYRAALDECGLNRQECLQIPTEDMVHQIVHCDSRPTGIVAYSNFEATVLAHAMWQYGIGIPGDISIVGFNDLFATRHMTPPLTTVGYDAVRIGEFGAQIVVGQIESPPEDGKPTVTEIKPKLVVRGSTGPPPEE